MLIDSLYNSLLEGSKKTLIFNDNYPKYEYRVLYELSDWKKHLEKGHYLYNTIYNNLKYNIKNLNINEMINFTTLDIITYDNISGKENEKIFDKIAEELTDIEVQKILNICSNNKVYFITYCSDDGNSTNIDMAMRSYGEKIFRYCNHIIRDEHS